MNLENYMTLINALKMTQTYGSTYHAHGLEELIVKITIIAITTNNNNITRQSSVSVQSLSKHQHYFSQS